MSRSFWIDRSDFEAVSDPALLNEVRAHTGTDGEAESILRSIERLVGDPSISRFEMTPMKPRPSSRTTHVDWSVRPLRP